MDTADARSRVHSEKPFAFIVVAVGPGGGEQALELIGVQSLEDAINAAFEDVGMDESGETMQLPTGRSIGTSRSFKAHASWAAGAAQQRADETAEEMEEEGENAGAAAVAQDGSKTEGQREGDQSMGESLCCSTAGRG